MFVYNQLFVFQVLGGHAPSPATRIYAIRGIIPSLILAVKF
jgi:uncharacterized protein (DUF1810 family)